MTARMTVEDLMTTALTTAHINDTVEAADFDMKLANIRHIPVIDDRRRLVGIVSNRDILRAFGESSKSPIRIRDIMTAKVRSVGPSVMASDAARELMEHKISSLPVIGDDGQLVGLVTGTDFIRIAEKALRGESPSEFRD